MAEYSVTYRSLFFSFEIRLVSRWRLLSNESGKLLHFPKSFEVRFVEHQLNVIKAVRGDYESIVECLQTMRDGDSYSNKERAVVEGFLKTWRLEGFQVKMTALMGDILKHIEALQKTVQRDDLIIPDYQCIRAICCDTRRQPRQALLTVLSKQCTRYGVATGNVARIVFVACARTMHAVHYKCCLVL